MNVDGVMCALSGTAAGADFERRLARRRVVALALGADVGRLGVQRGDGVQELVRVVLQGVFVEEGVCVGVGVNATVGRVPNASKRTSS